MSTESNTLEWANDDPWKHRRRLMYGVTFFCMGVIGWVLYKDMTSAVAEAATMFAFVTMMSIVGSYVFGAAWDDKNTLDFVGKR